MDPRFKLAGLILLSLSALWTGLPGALVLVAAPLALLAAARLPWSSAFRDLKVFFILLAFVFVARALSAEAPPAWTVLGIPLSPVGLREGLLVAARLLAVTLLGLALVVTTRPSDITAAVEWALTPVPLVPGPRIAVMMGLIIRFIPLIFDQARETSDALKARGLENRRNPVRRLAKLILPLVRRTFLDADQLALAMEARCYSERRTGPELHAAPRDWIGLGIVAAVGLLTVIL